jgi:subtilisin family serine protease
MTGTLRRGPLPRRGTCPFPALCASSVLAAILWAGPAAAQSPPYVNAALRWIGTAAPCKAPAGWTAEPVFRASPLPADLAGFCLYTWTAGPGSPPTSEQVRQLFAASGAQGLTEDAPVLYPSAGFIPEQVALFAGLRGALRAQVGDASLLPGMPATPAVRIAVIDSAPDAAAGLIRPGASRHGDTLAHLIEDLVCRPASGGRPAACAAEVTTVLALPWLSRGVAGLDGGYLGTLSDLARAIEQAVSRWQSDRHTAPASTPARLLLNLSVGWEDTPKIADCSTAPASALAPPARAVRTILQHAAAAGALIVAAAGNDSAGPAPRTGLLCPGRYQAVPQDLDPSHSLVVAVSGVDYQDHALETARPLGITGIAGLGLGGVAWAPADPVPPPLVGSSVSAAVVSAVSALVWAARPNSTMAGIVAAVYAGGRDVGAADACPLSLAQCRSHRASVCGALQAAGVSPICVPPPPRAASCPSLPTEADALADAFASVVPGGGAIAPLASVPRSLAPTVQVEPSVFPQPISGTCPTCWVDAESTSPALLTIPALGQDLQDAMLVVRWPDTSLHAIALGTLLANAAPYAFPLPPGWTVQSAYVSGFDSAHQYSITEQIFVAR